jgi:hypothetical protein
MIRFIIKRRLSDSGSQARTTTHETIDAECPELQRALEGSSWGPRGYDLREVVGVEVLPVNALAPLTLERIGELEASAWSESADEPAFECVVALVRATEREFGIGGAPETPATELARWAETRRERADA